MLYRTNPEVKRSTIESALVSLIKGESGSIDLKPIAEQSLWLKADGNFKIVEGLREGGELIFEGDKENTINYLVTKSKESAKGEIPEAEIKDKKIKLGEKWYNLIMCYLCPIEDCNKPIIAYWKVPIRNQRTTSGIVGKALRDSGFGGYRFFETEKGQGFEYDPEKDPRKRHQHSKEKSYYWKRGPKEYEILWVNFIKLNPIFSLNDFFSRTINPHGDEFGKDHRFINTQSLADIFLRQMKYHANIFKVSNDIMNHGKPIFYFNLVEWEDKTRYAYSLDDRMGILMEWFGKDNINKLEVKK